MKFNLTDIFNKATSPKAYSTYAVIGVLATTALAIYCTKKECKAEKNSQTDISEEQDDIIDFESILKSKSDEMTREEVIEEVKHVAVAYAPVIASAALTIFCIRKSNAKWMAYNGLINASYIAARDKMARYRALAPVAVGAELIKGFGDRPPAEEGVEWFCLKDGLPQGESDIYFQSTVADVYEAEYHLNRNFQLRSSASVREFFAFLGILDQFPEEYEDAFGWDAYQFIDDGLCPWIDFEHWHVINEDGIRINMITYTWEPGFSEDKGALAWGYGSVGSHVENHSFGPAE